MPPQQEVDATGGTPPFLRQCHRAQPGLDRGDGHCQSGNAHRERRSRGRWRQSHARGQNNVQGSCDMGSFPHELPGYRQPSGHRDPRTVRAGWQVALDPDPGMRIPNMFDSALDGDFRGLYCQGRGCRPVRPLNTQHIQAAPAAPDCLVVQDIFLNETAKYAHVFLPGLSFLEKRHFHQRRAADFARAK